MGLSKYFGTFLLVVKTAFAGAVGGRDSVAVAVFATTMSAEDPVELNLATTSPPNRKRAMSPRIPAPIVIER